MTESGERQASERKGRSRRGRASLWLLLSLALVAAVAGFATLAFTGRPLPLPGWAVTEAETRINRALEPALSVSLGGLVLTVEPNWIPRLRLDDVRLRQADGRTLVTLPEARVVFDRGAALRGALHPKTITLSGARISLRRLADGRFDFAMGEQGGTFRIASYAELRETVDRLFAQPVLADLRRIEAEGTTLTLDDRRAGRTWQAGDGRLTLVSGPDRRALEIGLTLLNSKGRAPAQALVTFVTTPGSPEARISATVDHVAAADIAAQAAPVAWLEVLDAALSGRFSAALDGEGRLTRLEAGLDSGEGALQPRPETRPIAFDRAGLAFAYDPGRERLNLTRLEVQGRSIRLSAQGHAYLPGVSRGLPSEILAQIRVEDASADPEGLFETPVHFSEGALDLRMRLDPFRVDIGQLALVEEGRRLSGRGHASAEPGGWRVAFDLGLNEISHSDLLALWPLSLVSKTREWLEENVQEGRLFEVEAGLRMSPGHETRLSLGYEFRDGDVRYLKTLPPIEKGSGYASIEDRRYLMVLEEGQVTPPAGGPIRVTRSVFEVPDVTEKPAQARISLNSESGVTAALSLLDQPPFRFLEKAGRSVDLGEGRAVMETALSLPLKRKVEPEDVEFSVRGTITDFRSDTLVPGRRIVAPRLALEAEPEGLTVTGAGSFGRVPFDATYRLAFGREAEGRSSVEGTATLSPAAVEEFKLGLPAGTVEGRAPGRFRVEMAKGRDPRLTLSSDLVGLRTGLAAIGWSKPANRAGRLEVEASLGKPVTVGKLVLEGGGLAASGRVDLRADGGLDAVRFDRVRLNGWLDAPVTLVGRGANQPPEVQLRGGSVDLTRLGDLGGGGGGGGTPVPILVALDRLQVTSGIALTGVEGRFGTRGGFNGAFRGRVNGRAVVEGSVVPMSGRSAVRLRSRDAGGVIASAGIFPDARGGDLDLSLTPEGRDGYRGQAAVSNFRVTNAPVLAALLNAISVVGLLEQLNGDGLLFAEGDVRFRVQPGAVEISEASAVGASMGVTLEGLYRTADRRLDLQGVISPIYLLNGIGSVLTRRGEGLFGFNYSVTGSADRPAVSVNPLSILTPGMFREIFRRPVPVLP
ncbi:AsmA-like C-terminal region-containing protein [Cereibacter sphaeroides]|uniref:AsmA-like C-terminal region-containing protein n=1 Tax=Cereibacter sphaeroides TaxID=1063 RepID=UPI003FCE57CF